VSGWRKHPVRAAAAALAGAALIVLAWPAASHWLKEAPHLAGVVEADALALQDGVSLGVYLGEQPKVVRDGVATVPWYLNPLRDVSNLSLERIDQGVDFAGSGPVYALGDGVVTNASGDYAGWPGGGWITYQLTDGPAAGLMVYVAEDITPTVQVGQQVTAWTVIGDMFEGYDGIETGWAQPGALSAESQLSVAGAIGGEGPFPTMVGVNFDELLQSLGVPPAPNRYDTAYGVLPANYPSSWG
jgi:murein DD-endopeptidase MepM/ murein hydrolase activator NlpD